MPFFGRVPDRPCQARGPRERTPPETLERLLPTIRRDVSFESEEIRDAEFPNVTRMREWGATEENAAALAQFLDISDERATEIASTEHLFAD